jgi:nitroreductase
MHKNGYFACGSKVKFARFGAPDLAQVCICTKIRATTEASRLARTMSRDANSAPPFPAPRTAAAVLSNLQELAQSNPTVLQQQPLRHLEVPERYTSEEELQAFRDTVDNMHAQARLLALFLNQLSERVGEKLDLFLPYEVGCTTYYAVKAKRDAEYRESLPHAIADSERFLKPQPAPAAEDAQAAGSSHDMLEPPSKRLRID